jgi:metallophosphoesterase (TIGR00282 family)
LTFRLLFIGDVVGSAGVSAVLELVPGLREDLGLDAVVANGENSAPSGRGITAESGAALLSVVDFLTLGNHSFDADGHGKFLENEERVVRPANFAESLPGRGAGIFESGGVTVGVTNVLGRVFVEKKLSSPFDAADRAIEELRDLGADLVFVDAHAEATSEKQALGYHLAGKAQAVLGTHTHVSTADHQVLSGGTAYATDVGMTGREGSVIGFDRADFLGAFLGEERGVSVATEGPVVLRGMVIHFDPETGEATSIKPVWRRVDQVTVG